MNSSSSTLQDGPIEIEEAKKVGPPPFPRREHFAGRAPVSVSSVGVRIGEKKCILPKEGGDWYGVDPEKLQRT